MSSAICFNLDWSEILSSGNGLMKLVYHSMSTLLLCLTSLFICIIPVKKHSTVMTHYHTMPHFDAPKIYSCGKHCKKRRNRLLQAISLYLTMFSTLYGNYFSFKMHFKMLSAICFSLDQPRILSSGNR